MHRFFPFWNAWCFFSPWEINTKVCLHFVCLFGVFCNTFFEVPICIHPQTGPTHQGGGAILNEPLTEDFPFFFSGNFSCLSSVFLPVFILGSEKNRWPLTFRFMLCTRIWFSNIFFLTHRTLWFFLPPQWTSAWSWEHRALAAAQTRSKVKHERKQSAAWMCIFFVAGWTACGFTYVSKTARVLPAAHKFLSFVEEFARLLIRQILVSTMHSFFH